VGGWCGKDTKVSDLDLMNALKRIPSGALRCLAVGSSVITGTGLMKALEGQHLDTFVLSSSCSQKIPSAALESPALRTLRSLHIQGIQGVGSSVARFLPQLENLLLSDVKTEVDIEDIWKLQRLRTLSVNSCNCALQVEPFLRIFIACADLRDIDIYGCTDVTHEMLKVLRKKTLALQSFRGSNVHGARLSGKDVRALKLKFPSAKVFVDNVFAENFGVNMYHGSDDYEGSEPSDSAQSTANVDSDSNVMGADAEETGVVASIIHQEPAAFIPPVEAAAIETQQQAGREARVAQSSGHGDADVFTQGEEGAEVVKDNEPIYLLEFTRHPASFRTALIEGEDLSACREALRAAGHECVLPSGAKIFVHPSQYQCAMLAMRDLALRPFHIVVAESLEGQVMKSLESLPCRSGARVRTRFPLNHQTAQEAGSPSQMKEEKLPACERSSEDWETDDAATAPLIVSRTFLCVAPLMRNSDSVTQWTTEVHTGVNPRRHCLAA